MMMTTTTVTELRIKEGWSHRMEHVA